MERLCIQKSLPETCRRAAAPGGEDCPLALVHEAGLDGIAVVVTDQVEHAVGDEQI
jgi:hypothetical protein